MNNDQDIIAYVLNSKAGISLKMAERLIQENRNFIKTGAEHLPGTVLRKTIQGLESLEDARSVLIDVLLSEMTDDLGASVVSTLDQSIDGIMGLIRAAIEEENNQGDEPSAI